MTDNVRNFFFSRQHLYAAQNKSMQIQCRGHRFLNAITLGKPLDLDPGYERSKRRKVLEKYAHITIAYFSLEYIYMTTAVNDNLSENNMIFIFLQN
jgi:hypothetical protein